MEVVDKENIKVPNSVIVSGITDTEVDETLMDFLNKYGKIMRTFKIDDPLSSYHKNAIVEYESGAALTTLEPLLPYILEVPNKVTYKIKALSSEYMSAVTKRATHHFFCELQEIAKLTGKSFEAVLHEHLSKCSQSDASSPKFPETEHYFRATQSDITKSASESNQPFEQFTTSSNTDSEVQTADQRGHDLSSNIPQNFISHPEVQKVIVEHIVRNETPVSHVSSSFRLRQFSGKLPCPSHEADFDTWRNSVELILQDSDLSDLQRSRKILDSLGPPAANVVKPLGPKALPTAYLELLNSAFGTVEDGDELFAKFLNTFQDPGEKPSHYLHRLQTVLCKALSRGGAVASESDRHLLRQFCRGCWDNALLAELQLERKKDKPPSFTELLLQLRVEEDKHTAKESRMKKHFAAAKPKVASHTIAATPNTCEPTMQTDLADMQTQITKLQSQLTRLKPHCQTKSSFSYYCCYPKSL
ncbi:uncharacterized protein LOC106531439, partial [Austrofundulus limnaeus]|uniref:Uncharacterized protein LOC106531439 n=1 Tax=Austrofundulus limnaeus TaxID=52670 RepID=A0A2I4CRZ8_AUSLI